MDQTEVANGWFQQRKRQGDQNAGRRKYRLAVRTMARHLRVSWLPRHTFDDRAGAYRHVVLSYPLPENTEQVFVAILGSKGPVPFNTFLRAHASSQPVNPN